MARATVTGYCWPQSVAPGQQVGLHLSATDGRVVRVEVARVGGERTVVHNDDVPAGDYPTPLGADRSGCAWPVATSIDVRDHWRSGYYEVVLEIDDGGKRRQSHAFFVVRPAPGRAGSRILLALATNTWHAYNEFGGNNLYSGGTAVSLQRPMTAGFLHKPPGPGRRVTNLTPDDHQMTAHVGYLRLNHLSPWAGSAGWPDWEHPFLEWAERNGIAIDVVTNPDLEDHPWLLGPDSPYRLFLSVGHDEYWSMGMRDAVEGFTARGGNAAFFSGNTSLWQVRLEDRTPEGPAGRMVGYKAQFKQDPVYGTDRIAELTSFWSDHEVGRPENALTGVSFTRGGYHRIGPRVTNGLGGYTVHRADHWIFEGTGLDYGDVLGAGATVVGYECDGCELTYRDGLPYPTGADGTPANLQILGTTPVAHFTRDKAPRPPRPQDPSEIEFIAARVFGDRSPEAVQRIAHGHAVLGTFTTDAGGTVITSGSTDWAHGLAGRDPQIERITTNILTRLSAAP